MTRRLIGGIVAAVFALGILTGAAGAIVLRDASTPQSDLVALMADHMDGFGMSSMMSGWMMGPGSSVGPGMMSGPAASWMPSLHQQHHPAASQDGSR
ncbi:MAG TPA: hypothetical protein VK194_12045 [Candidatus Deferrimicrobium sp.]|nr:hypothetical protein [Candidatus Deferrimicrobium sp.]